MSSLPEQTVGPSVRRARSALLFLTPQPQVACLFAGMHLLALAAAAADRWLRRRWWQRLLSLASFGSLKQDITDSGEIVSAAGRFWSPSHPPAVRFDCSGHQLSRAAAQEPSSLIRSVRLRRATPLTATATLCSPTPASLPSA